MSSPKIKLTPSENEVSMQLYIYSKRQNILAFDICGCARHFNSLIIGHL